MDSERMARYEGLKALVKPTPLVRLPIDVPNGNVILAKLEYDFKCHPNGCHYDRAYPWLLEDAELNGIPTPKGERLEPISPESSHIVEVSTGNAGASAAWVCRKMGYALTVIVPNNLPVSRLEYIMKHGPTIIEAERTNYMEDSINVLKELIAKKTDEKGRSYVSLNHAFNPLTTDRLTGIMEEALEQKDGLGMERIDCFVSTAGNGASTLGTGRLLKKRNPNAKVVCWEQFMSGLAFSKHYPGKYWNEWRVMPGELFIQPRDRSRELLGNYGPGTETPFLDQAYDEGLIDETVLVADMEMIEAYLRHLNSMPLPWEAKKLIERNVRRLTDWEKPKGLLESAGFNVGNTSIGGVAVALKRAELVKDETMLTIFYDSREKYMDRLNSLINSGEDSC